MLSRPSFAFTEKITLLTESLPPYQMLSKDKKITGFATDVIRQTMERSHYTSSLHLYPWARSYNLALQKKNHCIFSIARLAVREKSFKWVGPLSKISNAVIYGLKKRNFDIQTLDDAKKYIIVVIRNNISHLGLLERGFVEGKNLYVLDDAKSLVSLLASRPEIDLIISDDITIDYRAELAGMKSDELQRVFEIKELSLDFYFACSLQTDDNVIKHLSEKMESLYLDGTYQKIWEKWQNKFSYNKEP
ncbi:MAG: polar amino acid transport system substrate-binding protein [Alteromonadaceae bacterium]|jgi:polar amino acid transport system substrate-binding protein